LLCILFTVINAPIFSQRYLLEFDDKKSAELLEMMEKSILVDDFEKQYYVHLYDRVQANQRKPQRYGTHPYQDAKTGNWKLSSKPYLLLPPLKK
jgi:hypothetical protein